MEEHHCSSCIHFFICPFLKKIEEANRENNFMKNPRLIAKECLQFFPIPKPKG